MNFTSVETLKLSGGTVYLTYGPADTTPPTVSSVTPANAATAVVESSNISVTFSESVQIANSANIVLHEGSATGTAIAVAATVSGSILTIDPTPTLKSSTSYYLTMASGSVTDLASNAYAGGTYSFTTGDTIAPTVSTFSPADTATGVAVASNIVLTFSENIQKGTTGLIKVYKGSVSGTPVESYDLATNTAANLTVSGSTLTINPTANLTPDGSTYYVTIDSGAIKDAAGNSYTGTTTYHFATVDTTAPTVSTFSPADTATGVAVASNIVLTFSENIQKGTTGLIKVYKGSVSGTPVESYDLATNTAANLTV
ncbi:MAG: Ig-like domain-containing protein, partial [Chlorobaculum sp.]|nr:Ig-like domain-containing protein [Chlorobaculum sp.]